MASDPFAHSSLTSPGRTLRSGSTPSTSSTSSSTAVRSSAHSLDTQSSTPPPPSARRATKRRRSWWPIEELQPGPTTPPVEATPTDSSMEGTSQASTWRKTRGYALGPELGSAPVKCITNCLARRDGTHDYYMARMLVLPTDRPETQDERHGKMLLHTEQALLALLGGGRGVIRMHDLVKDTYMEQRSPSQWVRLNRITLILDCLVPNLYCPNSQDFVSLQQHVIKQKRLGEKGALGIFYHIVSIVCQLHQRNVIHRDLKLGNVVLDRRSQTVILTNFCLGKHLMSDQDLLTDQRGSPAYISPDVLSGKPYLGKPSDVWALGVVLFTMLYGQFPFYHSLPQELFNKIKSASFKLHGDVRVSEECKSLIKKILVVVRLLSGGGGIGGVVCGVRLVQPWQSLSSFVLYPVVQKGSWVPLIGQFRSHGSHLRPHPHPLVWSHPTHFRSRLVTQKACFSATMTSMKYPNPRRDAAVVEEHFGIKVADPYRWMEDPDSQETKDFVDQQNAVSQPFIESCSEREEIKRELTKLWNYPKYGVPHRHGKKYYFSKNNGIQNQSVMYTQDSLVDDPHVFLDPNSLSEDGTVSLNTTAFSEDGSEFAYGLSKSGSDWFDVHFKNVESGENYPEVLTKIKFSPLTWTHDSKGIFYGYYPDHVTGADGRDTASHDNQKLYYHRIGTPQSEDVLCVDFPEHPKWRVEGEVSDCGRYLLVCPGVDCQDNLVFFADLEALPNGITGKISLTQIIFKFEADYQYVTNTGSKFVFRSNKNAPRYQLICIDLEHPEEKNWSFLIPEHESNILEWATCVDQDKLVVCYMEDVKSILKTHDLNSGAVLHEFPLGVGSIVGVSGEKKHSELFYKFSSMITPGIIYFVDMSTKNPVPKVFIKTEIEGLDESKCEVKQVFYPSKDGTKIPMFIAHRKDEKLDGNSPCLLYGYGGFNVSLTPSFSISQLFFIQHFGVLAIPNIRGGGEYGRTWHDGGRLLNKQNVFDDFVAAAEFLVQNKYTRKEKLTIKGGSNGGLLVGACLNQRPDLFGAGVAAVGVMDMIRFHKFTIGHAWCSDFGNPETEEHFKYLLTYSPLHNIRVPEGDVQYPCLLLTTADHDDRVVPSHSLKFIAELQQTLREVQKQTNPLLIRVETKAGHGGGKPTSKSIEEITDVLCFLVKTLGYEFK